MSLLHRAHAGFVHPRRAASLCEAATPWIPQGARVLDVGCGDGLIAWMIQERRPDVRIVGTDVLVRPETRIPVEPFDGRRLPHGNAAFDVVLLLDVLHHAEDPGALIAEAARVTSDRIVVKDHLREGFLAGPVLRIMDRIGNSRHGVAPAGDYWPESVWRETFFRMNLALIHWTREVRLYPWWAAWIFGRSLHFVACLGKERDPAAADRTAL